MSKMYIIHKENLNKALLEGAIILGIVPQDLGQDEFSVGMAASGEVILSFDAEEKPVSQTKRGPGRPKQISNTAPKVQSFDTEHDKLVSLVKLTMVANNVLQPPGKNTLKLLSTEQLYETKAWAEAGADEKTRPEFVKHRKPRTPTGDTIPPPSSTRVTDVSGLSLGEALGNPNMEHPPTAAAH
jgi:hypothetical protein